MQNLGYTLEDDGEVLTLTTSGVLNRERIAHMRRDAIAEFLRLGLRRLLIDMRESQLTDSPEEMRAIGRDDAQEFSDVRIAMVVGRAVDYGMLRMWDMTSEYARSFEADVFEDIEAGRRWLLTSQ